MAQNRPTLLQLRLKDLQLAIIPPRQFNRFIEGNGAIQINFYLIGTTREIEGIGIGIEGQEIGGRRVGLGDRPPAHGDQDPHKAPQQPTALLADGLLTHAHSRHRYNYGFSLPHKTITVLSQGIVAKKAVH